MSMMYQAPWNLIGEGIVLTHRAKKKWMLENGCIPAHLQNSFKGGLAFTMLVDYHEADCGPYKELLFIPGFFLIDNRYRLMITKIYVDSEDSIISGRKNWGIPKEMAKITWENSGSKTAFKASINDELIFESQIQTGTFTFPINTKLSPFRMHQVLNDKSFVFKPSGKGKSTYGKLQSLSISKDYFPNIEELKLVNCLHIKKFNLLFPASKIESL
jgi:hypothetical protein